MDQIKEYIKNLFRGIPETPDVLRAKAELMEMMEDKYEQLLQEGKSPQEAFGTVVSEFGDLEELSEAMGISFSERTDDQTGRDTNFRGFVNEKMPKNGYYANLEPHEIWDKDRTQRFLDVCWKHALYIAIGVACFLLAPKATSVTGDVLSWLNLGHTGLSSVVFMVMIAVGVVFCIQAGHQFKLFGYKIKQVVGMDLASGELLKQRREKDAELLYKLRLTGILLLIFSVVPDVLSFVPDQLGECLMFGMFAAGVGLLIVNGSMGNRYQELGFARLYNESRTNEIAGDYFVKNQPRKMSGGAVAVIVISVIVVIGVVITTAIVSVLIPMKKVVSTQWDAATEVAEMSEDNFVGGYNLQDGGTVEMDLDAASVRVEMSSESNDRDIKVYYMGNSKDLNVTETKGTHLSIKDDGADITIFGKNSTKKHGNVIVRIPYNSKHLKYQISVDAGRVDLDGLIGSDLSLEVDAGDIRFNNCDISNADVTADAGNFTVSRTDFDNLTTEVDAGNIDIETLSGLSCYSYRVSTDMGKVQAGNQKKSGVGGCSLSSEAAVTDLGRRHIEADVDMGNIKIK